MRRKYISVSTVIATLVVLGGLYILFGSEIQARLAGKPKVVSGYLCSDICSESDVKKYYEGVTDTEECKKIGGKPYTYYGWGEFHASLTK